MQKVIKPMIAILILAFVAMVGYWLGQKGSEQQTEIPVNTEVTVKEIDQIQRDLNDQNKAFQQQLEQIQTKIATVKAQSQNLQVSPDESTIEIEKQLQQAKQGVAVLKAKDQAFEVPIPAESPSGKVLNQPKTASGVSIPMLENYQQETGVDPQEVEALMQQ